MASIHGFGNIGPIPGGPQSRPAQAPKELEANPQVGSDGLSINFDRSGEPASRPVASPATESVRPQEATPSTPAAASSATRVPTTLSMEDGLAGISSVGLGSTEKIGLSAFTNGLGSTQLVSLNGKVLADLSSFRSAAE